MKGSPMEAKAVRLNYSEWQALAVLYKHRDRVSSPLRYVGLKPAIVALTKHDPPLAQWVGKASKEQVHITIEGVAYYESDR
jgi:hypothetical protein